MAAIAPKLLIYYAATLLALALPAYADRSADVLATVHYLATALSDGNAVDAMTPFEHSFTDYEKLRGYFAGLVARGSLTNEVSIVDEKDSENETAVTVEWTLNITKEYDQSDTERRVQQLRVRVVSDHGKWKIIELSPTSFFDPTPKPKSQ